MLLMTWMKTTTLPVIVAANANLTLASVPTQS